jgi:hypothetical protein
MEIATHRPPPYSLMTHVIMLQALKGQSHQLLDDILDSWKLNQYLLQDRLQFLHYFILLFMRI